MEASASSLPLHGRVAIVTGASRGIGRAIAIHLRSLGARVVINYASNSAQADQVVSELNASTEGGPTPPSPHAVAIKADISDADQVKHLFDRTEQEFGKGQLQILVNCAGVLNPKYPALVDMTVEDWERTFSVNTRGSFLCCKEAASRLKRGGGGRIIMISSSAVGSLYPGYSAYAASKAATETMVKILAKELTGTGITANCVAPGPVATELFFAGKTEEKVERIVEACPMKRLGQPDDVAPLVGFLATDAGQWVNGQVIRVNGGACV
ncbi:hypothetical protein SAY86_010867 [Trapa natans]|uniref:Ketoreductase domain-containing protein n=1 Tax=Trapa natans TaxID=22666 RepID=A0AAN7LMB5_TRANT|nr:hypothetical protein SAY86_010867 [Trapa natans]